MQVMDSSRIAKIRSLPGYSVLEYKKEDIAPDVRALLLATAIWLVYRPLFSQLGVFHRILN